jgi:hypothetical protein
MVYSTLTGSSISGTTIATNTATVQSTTTVSSLTASGVLGIGTANPNVALYVNANASTAGTVMAAHFSAGAYLNGSATLIGISAEPGNWAKVAIGHVRTSGYDVGDLVFLTRSSVDTASVAMSDERMRITSGGNVGIGTVNAVSMLTIWNQTTPNTSPNLSLVGYSTSPGTGPGINFYCWISAITPQSRIEAYDDNNYGSWLTFSTKINGDGSNLLRESLRLGGPSGNVGIGIASPSATLDVNGTARIGSAPANSIGGDSFKITIGADANGQNPMSIYSYADANYIIAFFNTAKNVRGSIIGVNSSSISFNTTSDARRKTNITDMPSMIQKIKQLKPRSYIWKESDDKDDGFVAQEVHKVFPQFMTSATAYANVCKHSYSQLFDGNLCTCCDFENPIDKDGKPQYYGLDYGKFTPYLTKALQETIDMVEAQAKRIEVLEAQVTALLQK